MEFAFLDLIYTRLAWNRLFFQRMMSISLCSRLNFGELREICYIRVVPSLTLGLVWLFLVVANRADLAVLAQDLGEMRGICLVRGQFLLLAGPGKTPLPVQIAQKSASLTVIVGEWREICSVHKQFLLFVCKRLTKTIVSFKSE